MCKILWYLGGIGIPGRAATPQILRYIGIFLISVATLVLEISLTRVLSVAQWYHFAFMVVSIALFGFGASGTLLSVFPRLMDRGLDQLATISSALFSVACVGSFVLANRVHFDPFRLAWDPMQVVYIIVDYAVLSIPFFLSGLCITSAMSKMAENVNKLYFSNLVGSGCGSILVILLFPHLKGSGVIAFASFLGGASALVFSLNLVGRRRTRLLLVWMIAISLLFFKAQNLLPISISPYKSLPTALRYPDSELLETEWNAFSRVDVIKSGFVRYAPGLSLQYYKPIPQQLGVTVDGDALNAITNYDGVKSSLEFTGFLPMSLPYHTHTHPHVLVLGAGGGLGVLTAMYHNASSIVAVEVNPIIVDLVRNRYREFAGDIYGQEDVRVGVSESRSFIRGSRETYDIIELSMTDNAAASSTGIYALSENYLYTTEAFEDYYAHLSEGGVLSVTRWLLPPPREDIRVVSLAVSALENQGVGDPEDHIAIIRSWSTITLLVKKGRLTTEDGSVIREFCGERKFDIVHMPGLVPSDVNIYNKFPEPYYYRLVHEILYSEDRTGFYREYLFDIAPVTDERPFFFHFFKWDRLSETYESLSGKWQPLVEGGYLVQIVFIQALFLSLVFIFLPMRRFRRETGIIGRGRLLAYFLCLGLGYMFIEIALIQKSILFLGHPVHAVSAVLFSLLVSSGVGSYLSGRLKLKGGRVLIPIILSVCLLAVAYPFLLRNIFSALLGQPMSIRLPTLLLLIAPLGLVLGMPFPTGMRLLNDLSNELIPWAWAVNGCASVLGSILPVIVALSFGFSAVVLLASATYLVGLLMIISFQRVVE